MECIVRIFAPVSSATVLATAWVLWQGSGQVLRGLAGGLGMTVGVLQVFINYTLMFFQPVRDIARIFAELQSSQAAAERVLTLLDTKPDIVDSPEVEAVFGDSFHPKKENWPAIRGEIELEDVSFRYQDGEQVLSHFSLHVNPGETIALVGETGAGKSTIVNLVCRFYEPTEGRVLIDGVDYRERSQLWLQSGLGYVLQTPHLFSGTVADNIRYGRPDATDEEVEEAARKASIHDFILTLPQGYDTNIGELGDLLSEGEKQRIGLARAFLHGAPLMLLDEPTSNLDSLNEGAILRALREEVSRSGRTVVLVSHRKSTLSIADRDYSISDGRFS